MALTTVNRNSAALVTITFAGGSAKTYNAQFTRFTTRFVCGELETTTLASEVNGEYEQTASRCILTYAGITKTGIDGTNGAAVHAKLGANPASVVSIYQFASGANVAVTLNYNDHTIDRQAGLPSVFSGQAVSTGTYVITWPES